MASSYAAATQPQILSSKHLISSQLAKNQMSVLAQAKPAIIQSTLDEEAAEQPPPLPPMQLASKRYIEDENVINKQNATNQMRQAAVLAAVASQQQKVRLSATERLAMTAKKPAQRSQPEIVASSKPTLETLLAVQRQLHQHTRQNLNPLSASPTTQQPKMVSPICSRLPAVAPAAGQQRARINKPLPPAPPKSVERVVKVPDFPAPPPPAAFVSEEIVYEKDLPPLPDSPACGNSSSEDSQLNSLDSQHSSPSTSLVSIPPPPPPLISSYLEHYDEVSYHSSSSPASSEVSSIINNNNKPQVIIPQVKQQHVSPTSKTPQAATKSANQNIYYPFQQQRRETLANFPVNQQPKIAIAQSDKMAPSEPQVIQQQQQQQQQQHLSAYQQHLFKPPTLAVAPHKTPQLALPASLSCNLTAGGFDQPDSGNFRFPTPPPPEILLADDEQLTEKKSSSREEDDDDDDFQCNIPTPPLAFKTMSGFSASSFTPANQQTGAELASQQVADSSASQLTVHINNNEGGLLSTASSAMAASSAALGRLSAANRSHHHHQTVNHRDRHQREQHQHEHHQHHQHHQEQQEQQLRHLMSSSSSPSSSSDGDGHSSTASSSSTSGIHSSIDSPSSSSSKLDDFNYSAATIAKMMGKTAAKLPLRASSGNKQPTSQQQANIKSALKPKKKSVSFSDKVELVACADEQTEDHLPNPLLARVLAAAANSKLTQNGQQTTS